MEWSKGVYDVLNIDPGDVVPSRAAIRELVHPDDRRPHDEMDRLYASGNSFEIEYRIIMRDRRVRWIRNQGEFLMDAEGKPNSVFGILSDVHAPHVAADVIDDFRRRFNTLLKLRTAIVWTAGPDGNITSIPDWKTAFACDEEPLGLKMQEIIHSDDRDRSREEWAAAISIGHRYIAEHRMLNINGSYRWYRCSALPIKNPNGKVREWLGVSIDIDDEKTGGAIKGIGLPATGAQIRAARSILRLSVKDISDISGVPSSTIRRIEDIDGTSDENAQVSLQLRVLLEQRGVNFLFPAGLKPAVCPA